MNRYFPLINDLKNYDSKKLRGDFSAGLTVGVMLVPQGMAYAMIAGLPPIYGLYTAIFPQLIYAFIGTSRQLAVGPVAMDSIIVATGVSLLAVVDSANYIALTILLALIIGAIQLTMGVLKLGFIVNFLSRPVIQGFTFAAAFVISINQLKYLAGVELSQTGYIHQIILELGAKFNEINSVAFSIGMAALLFIWTLKRWNKRIPGALAAVVLSTLCVYLFDLGSLDVSIVGDVPQGLPFPKLPVISKEAIFDLIPVAITLALIGFMEAFSIAKSLEAQHRGEYKIDPNKDLAALGASNIFGSFFSCFPASGGFSRSAMNESFGSRTGLTSLISAFLVMITVLFFTQLFYYLPHAVLASVIITAVMNLVDFNQIRHLWKSDRSDFYMLLVTFLGTLLVGIKEGIIVGVGLSLIMVIYRTTQPHIAVLGRMPGTSFFKNISRFKSASEIPGALIVRFDSRIYFANVNYFKKILEELIAERKTNLKLVILDAQSISSIDSSGMLALHELLDLCNEIKVKLSLTSVIGPVRDTFVREGFSDKLGIKHCFETIEEALSALHYNHDGSGQSVEFQSNVK